jgi:hypothetical protein
VSHKQIYNARGNIVALVMTEQDAERIVAAINAIHRVSMKALPAGTLDSVLTEDRLFVAAPPPRDAKP